MKLSHFAFAGVLLASPALSAPVVPPVVFSAGGNPVQVEPVITVDTTGAYVAGGGGGGAATIANGADTAEGSTTDSAYSGTGAGTTIGILKSINSYVGTPALPTGAATSALQTSGNTTLTTITGQFPASLGAKLSSGSFSIAPATDAIFAVQGNIASGATDSGAPVKTGGYASASLPTAVTAGQRVNTWLTLNGATVATLVDAGGNFLANSTSNADAVGARANGLLGVNNSNYIFNGTSWDRQRGDTTGIWQGGHSTINTGQVSVGTSATLIAAARTGRQKLAVTVTSAVQCSFGGSGVTLTTGWPLPGTAYVSDNWDTAAALYAVCASTATIGYRELY